MLDVKYVNEGTEPMMLIDNGAPKLIVSFTRLEGYLQDAKISQKKIKRENCARRFRMGQTVYLSDTRVTFPIVMKTEDKDYVKRNLVANLINLDEVNFLCGKETNKGWKTKVDMKEHKLEFRDQDKVVELWESEGCHKLAKLEEVGNWFDDESVYLVEKEEDVVSSEMLWRGYIRY